MDDPEETEVDPIPAVGNNPRIVKELSGLKDNQGFY